VSSFLFSLHVKVRLIYPPSLVDIDQTMTAEQNGFSLGTSTSGATAQSQSAPRNSIVDVFVYSTAFPSNYYATLHELKDLYEKRELNERDMLKLKLLAVLLVEQLLGQLSVDSPKVLGLMEEYDKLRGE